MVKNKVKIDHDKEANVLYITLGTGEPSYCEEVDDKVLVERGFITNNITGFRILDVKKREGKKIVAYGYVKKEEGIYTALCVNIGLFGQGKTPKEALRKVKKAIKSYIDFVFEKYPKEYKEFLDRPAPVNFIEEFKKDSNPFVFLNVKEFINAN